MLKIATVATHTDGYFPALKRICEKNKCHLDIIGFGQKWGGWDWRTNKIINYLQKCKMSDIVMLIDGFDVLVISTPEEIIEKFKKMSCNVLFSCSHISRGQPDNDSFTYKNIAFPSIKKYFKSEHDFILNAGTIMGYSKHLLQLYLQIQRQQKIRCINDDQILLNSMNLSFLKYNIDFDSNIFWIWEIDRIVDYGNMLITNETYSNSTTRYKNGRVIFSNGNQPCVVHGVNNRNMNEVCVRNNVYLLDYKPKEIQQKDLRDMIQRTRWVLYSLPFIYFAGQLVLK
jgi:hypothetical protein